MNWKALLLGACLVVTATGSAFANSTPANNQGTPASLAVTKEFTDLEAKSGTEAALDALGSRISDANTDPDTLSGAMRFLSDRDTNTTDPRYGLALAMVELKLANTYAGMKKPEDSGRFLFQSVARFLADSLILHQDKARCADKTAGNDALYFWQSPMETVLAGYKQLTPDQKKKVALAIDIYDTKKASRAPAAWVCRDGMDAVKIAQEKGLLSTTEKVVNGVKQTQNSTTASVDPYLKYIPDDEWSKARADVKASLIQALAK